MMLTNLTEPTYLFIDAEHLRQYYGEFAQAWFGSQGEIDFQRIKTKAKALRLFYYDSLDDQRKPGESTEDFEQRVARRKAEHSAVRSVEGGHVRLGTVTGEKKRRQKQVDILLAVDMITHAARQNMRSAILLTGDQDFKPVVDSLVSLGTMVAVWGTKKHISTALIESADSHEILSIRDFHRFTAGSLRQSYSLPTEDRCDYISGNYSGELRAKGRAGDRHVIVTWQGGDFMAYVPIPGTTDALTIRHVNYEQLKLFLAFEFGPTENL